LVELTNGVGIAPLSVASNLNSFVEQSIWKFLSLDFDLSQTLPIYSSAADSDSLSSNQGFAIVGTVDTNSAAVGAPVGQIFLSYHIMFKQERIAPSIQLFQQTPITFYTPTGSYSAVPGDPVFFVGDSADQPTLPTVVPLASSVPLLGVLTITAFNATSVPNFLTYMDPRVNASGSLTVVVGTTLFVRSATMVDWDILDAPSPIFWLFSNLAAAESATVSSVAQADSSSSMSGCLQYSGTWSSSTSLQANFAGLLSWYPLDI